MKNHRTEATASILLSLKEHNTVHEKHGTEPIQVLKDKDMIAAYLTGPAKKIAVRQVNRPAETTPSWLSLPCCHTILVFSTALSGKNSSRLCHTDIAALLLLEVDSFFN